MFSAGCNFLSQHPGRALMFPIHLLAQVKIKAPKKKLSNKEKKQRERVRKAKLARGEEVSDSEEDE